MYGNYWRWWYTNNYGIQLSLLFVVYSDEKTLFLLALLDQVAWHWPLQSLFHGFGVFTNCEIIVRIRCGYRKKQFVEFGLMVIIRLQGWVRLDCSKVYLSPPRENLQEKFTGEGKNFIFFSKITERSWNFVWRHFIADVYEC